MLVCWGQAVQLALCTAYGEQSNGWRGMAKREQIPRVGAKFTGSKRVVHSEFVPHGRSTEQIP